MPSDEQNYIEWANRQVWLDGCDLRTEYKQATEEGRDLAGVDDEFRRLLSVPPPDDSWHQHLGGQRDRAWLEAAGGLVDRVQQLPYCNNYPYNEPSDLAAIRTLAPGAAPLPPFSAPREKFFRQLHGGLLGRICGCMLGKPVECWTRNDIRITASATGNWPITNYFRLPTRQETAAVQAANPRSFFHGPSPLLLPDIHGMVEDDDINYTTLGFAMLKKCGPDFTPLDVADFWGNNLAIFHTCTAERVAYRNFTGFILPPYSATHRNPYREWIGAQIRGDYFGYANPANPRRAAEWAHRDAGISHVKNGIYGEMWVAAMLAAAYVLRDWPTVIRAGLAQIPSTSRLAAGIQKIFSARAQRQTHEEVVELIHSQWNERDHHDWCHTISNAQIVTAALLWGDDAYERIITSAVASGFDTDCNAATTGSLWGIMHGVDALPAKWTTPINDRLRTGVAGYHDVSIADLAREMTEIALKSGEQISLQGQS